MKPQETGARTESIGRLLRAFLNRDLELIRALASQGVSIDRQGSDGTTILMRAAALGEAAALRWMIEAGAALDTPSIAVDKNPGGRTALMLAAEAGHLACARALLDAGASTSATDAQEQTPLDWALIGGNREMFQLLEESSSHRKTPAPGTVAAESRQRLKPQLSRQSWRGIANPLADDVSIMVQTGVEETAAALAELLGAKTWEKNAHGLEVMTGGRCYLVFRITGHDWTVIRDAHDPTQEPALLSSTDARSLAAKLSAPAIFLAHLISRGSITWTYFSGAETLEHLCYHWASELYCESQWMAPDDDDEFFFSSRIAPQDFVIDDPELYVEQRLRQLGAFVPSWSRQPGSVQRLTIEGWSRNEFERLDYIAIDEEPIKQAKQVLENNFSAE